MKFIYLLRILSIRKFTDPRQYRSHLLIFQCQVLLHRKTLCPYKQELKAFLKTLLHQIQLIRLIGAVQLFQPFKGRNNQDKAFTILQVHFVTQAFIVQLDKGFTD